MANKKDDYTFKDVNDRKYGKQFESDKRFKDILSDTSIGPITKQHTDINSLSRMIEQSRFETKKELKGISSSVGSTARQQQKLVAQMRERETFSSKQIKVVEKSIQEVIGKLGYSVDEIAKGTKRMLTTTAIATKETLKEYGRALSADFNINKTNFLAMTLSKASPIFGYFAAKFMETSVFKRFTDTIREKFSLVATYISNRFKDIFKTNLEKLRDLFKSSKGASSSKKSGGLDDKIPKLQSGGYVKRSGLAEIHGAEVVVPIPKLIQSFQQAMVPTNDLLGKGFDKLLGTMGGLSKDIQHSVSQSFLRMPGFDTFQSMMTGLHAMQSVKRFFTGKRNRYTAMLSKSPNINERTADNIGVLFTNLMKKMDALIGNIGLLVIKAGGKPITEKTAYQGGQIPTWTRWGNTKKGGLLSLISGDAGDREFGGTKERRQHVIEMLKKGDALKHKDSLSERMFRPENETPEDYKKRISKRLTRRTKEVLPTGRMTLGGGLIGAGIGSLVGMTIPGALIGAGAGRIASSYMGGKKHKDPMSKVETSLNKLNKTSIKTEKHTKDTASGVGGLASHLKKGFKDIVGYLVMAFEAVMTLGKKLVSFIGGAFKVRGMIPGGPGGGPGGRSKGGAAVAGILGLGLGGYEEYQSSIKKGKGVGESAARGAAAGTIVGSLATIGFLVGGTTGAMIGGLLGEGISKAAFGIGEWMAKNFNLFELVEDYIIKPIKNFFKTLGGLRDSEEELQSKVLAAAKEARRTDITPEGRAKALEEMHKHQATLKERSTRSAPIESSSIFEGGYGFEKGGTVPKAIGGGLDGRGGQFIIAHEGEEIIPRHIAEKARRKGKVPSSIMEGNAHADFLEETGLRGLGQRIGAGIREALGPSSGFGWLSRLFESGGAGPGAIGWDRTGGSSYGSYQLAEKKGTVQDFFSKYPQIGNQFRGLTIGTPAFDAKWKSLASTDESFGKAQTDYISKAYLAPSLDKIKTVSNIDFTTKNPVLSEIALSTAVQYGKNSSVIPNAIAGMEQRDKDEDLIKRIGEYKFSNVMTNFRSSSPGVQKSVQSRIERETSIALGALGLGEGVNPSVLPKAQQGALITGTGAISAHAGEIVGPIRDVKDAIVKALLDPKYMARTSVEKDLAAANMITKSNESLQASTLGGMEKQGNRHSAAMVDMSKHISSTVSNMNSSNAGGNKGGAGTGDDDVYRILSANL